MGEKHQVKSNSNLVNSLSFKKTNPRKKMSRLVPH